MALVKWSENALSELKETYEYLEENWTENELRNLSSEIEKIIYLISSNPKLYPIVENNSIRRAVVKKINSLYYREQNDEVVEVLSFFSNRKNPQNRMKK